MDQIRVTFFKNLLKLYLVIFVTDSNLVAIVQRQSLH